MEFLQMTSTSSEQCYKEFKRVFHHFDVDGDEKISPAELCKCMHTIGEELSFEDAEELVLSTDTDGDGLLGFDDFLKLVEVEEEEERDRGIREAFGVYAVEELGCITAASLRTALVRLGKASDMEECKAMICRFDMDGDGVLSFEEFRAMMV